MYEVELKVEITEVEKGRLIEDFKKRSFEFKPATPQNDFYVHAQRSPYGAYDIKRYRDESGSYIYTEKVWEVVAGEPVQKEDEHEVSKEQFETAIDLTPDALKIKKGRNGSWELITIEI